MSVLEGVRSYYSLFGSYGVFVAAKARLFQTWTEVIVAVPGIRHPIHLRFRTTDVATLRQVLLIREYEWDFAKTPQVIVDAGANIGMTSVFYANKYPGAKIVAIEPESSNYEMLKKNIAAYANIIPVHGALWRDNNPVALMDVGSGHYGFQTTDEAKVDTEDGHERVPGMTVDKVMGKYGIDYIDILKVDIEGSEREVFETSLQWIDRVGVIVIELHDRLRTGCSPSVYGAAKDFESEARKGETVYLLRKDYVIDDMSRPRAAVRGVSNAALRQVVTKSPVRILRTV